MNMTEYKVGKINRICIGYVGEKQVEVIQFDFSEWVELYGEGILTMLLKRPGDENPYPVTLEQADGIASWTVTLADTEIKGLGEGQLHYYVGDGLKKSAVFPVHIERSLKAAVDPPDPYETWIDTLTELAVETQQNALDAEGSAANATESAEIAEQIAADALHYAQAAEYAAGEAREAELYAEQYASDAQASAADAWAASGGYMSVEEQDEHLIITITNCDTLTFLARDERLVVQYG